MKIYTKTGDAGLTGLFGGRRVSKAELRVCAYGDVDELNSQLGVLRAQDGALAFDELLHEIQNSLFEIGAELASDPERTEKSAGFTLSPAHSERLELAIDEHERGLAPLRQFILPGGSVLAAHFHVARTGCRRAERTVVALANAEAVRSEVLVYLNRLSDLFFVLGRSANKKVGIEDVPWTSGRTP